MYDYEHKYYSVTGGVNGNEQVSIVKKFMAKLTSLDDFQIIEKLGEGSYSTVYKVVRKCDNQVYSLKKVRIIEGLSDKER